MHGKVYREVRSERVPPVTEVGRRRLFVLHNNIYLLKNNKIILTNNYEDGIMTIERQYMERLANICRSRVAEMAAYIIRNEVQQIR